MSEGSSNVTTPLGWRNPVMPPEEKQRDYSDIELLLAASIEAAAKKHISKVIEDSKVPNE